MEDVINRLKQISDLLECQFGLLGKLGAKGVLTQRQVAEIQRPGSTRFEQNDKLIEFLTPLFLADGITLAKFLKSLRETGQSHLANRISASMQIFVAENLTAIKCLLYND